MTLYLTDNTTPQEIEDAVNSGIVFAVKLYPAGATTNSDAGVTDITQCYPSLEKMQALGLPLLVHGEATQSEIDIFDREKRFIDNTLKQLIHNFPELKIVFEHITTADAADFVYEGSASIAATITAHHLLMNRNDMLVGGIRPHHYCLPVLKREDHRLAEAFDKANALAQLEQFSSLNGPQFYGLKANRETITLKREQWTVPDSYPFGNEVVVPLRAGQTIHWKIENQSYD